MGRKRQKVIKCSMCGHKWFPNEVEPIKTWHLVSPLPDKQGRITITVMAVWECPNCGNKVRGVFGKTKVGDEKFKGENRTKKLIERLLEKETTNLKELAKEFRTSPETIRMAVEYLIKKGIVKGRINGDTFIRA
ncbi:MAG: DeoR family transcriptional regulator [Candidatus Njordarchaeales archaeon]